MDLQVKLTLFFLILIINCYLIEAPRTRTNRVANQVPDEILNDPLLNKSIETVTTNFYADLAQQFIKYFFFRFLPTITLKFTKLFGESEKLKPREVENIIVCVYINLVY